MRVWFRVVGVFVMCVCVCVSARLRSFRVAILAQVNAKVGVLPNTALILQGSHCGKTMMASKNGRHQLHRCLLLIVLVPCASLPQVTDQTPPTQTPALQTNLVMQALVDNASSLPWETDGIFQPSTPPVSKPTPPPMPPPSPPGLPRLRF